jgi:hypothetical protein
MKSTCERSGVRAVELADKCIIMLKIGIDLLKAENIY